MRWSCGKVVGWSSGPTLPPASPPPAPPPSPPVCSAHVINPQYPDKRIKFEKLQVSCPPVPGCSTLRPGSAAAPPPPAARPRPGAALGGGGGRWVWFNRCTAKEQLTPYLQGNVVLPLHCPPPLQLSFLVHPLRLLPPLPPLLPPRPYVLAPPDSWHSRPAVSPGDFIFF